MYAGNYKKVGEQHVFAAKEKDLIVLEVWRARIAYADRHVIN